jgi:N-acetylneuraminic acid mutarotase
MKNKFYSIILGLIVTMGFFGCDEQNTDLIGDWVRKTSTSEKGKCSYFVIDNFVYVVGGIGSPSTKTIYYDEVVRYNILTNYWDENSDELNDPNAVVLDSFPGGARYDGMAFSINGKGYYGCGQDKDNNYYKDFYEFDPSKARGSQWTRVADFPKGKTAYAVGFTIGGYGYAGLGKDEDGKISNKVYRFDPSSNTWFSVTNASFEERYQVSVFIINNIAYLAGGLKSGNALSQRFESFDPTLSGDTNKVTYLGDMNESKATNDGYSNNEIARVYGATFVISGKGYITMGTRSSSLTSDVWEYDPVADNWEERTAFEGTARNGGIGFSYNNIGYVGLGFSGGNYFGDLWSFDPNSVYDENEN